MKRLHDVCAEHGLGREAERKLQSLLELIARDPEAPSSVTAPDQAVDGHVADSLSALSILAGRAAPETIVDIGSGAGFPGLPLAVAFDQAEVELIESTERKCRFIRRAIEQLHQRNAKVVCTRAEDWARAGGAGRYELAVVRAVASLPTLIEYASPLLRDHGLLVAWKGARDAVEERRAAAAAEALGMTPAGTHAVLPFPGARHHHLHVFEKTGSTPSGVPRRPGMAHKRPFGEERSPPNY